MDKLLKVYKPKLNSWKKIENMNRPVIVKLVILKLPTKKSPGSDGFTGEFCHV